MSKITFILIKYKKLPFKNLITILFLSYYSYSSSQKIEITAYIPHAKELSKVSISRYLDDKPEKYMIMLDEGTIKNGILKKSFILNSVGIITLNGNQNVPSINLICDNGTVPKIFVLKKQGKFEVNFKGKNEKGQQLFYESDLFKSGNYKKIIQQRLEHKNTSVHKLIGNLEIIKDSLFIPFGILLKNKDITISFYNLVKKEWEANFSSAVYSVLLDNNNKHINQNDITKLLNYFYTKYDPFSKNYQNINYVTRLRNVIEKCDLIKEQDPNQKSNNIGLWNDSRRHFSFAPIDFQEEMKANDIILSRIYNLNAFEDDQLDFSVFKEVFPKSIYIQPLANYFKNLKINNEIKEFTLASYKKHEKKINILKVNKSVNIIDIIKTEFKGKYVLVDLWATWCAPCINEFHYKENITNFLKVNNIELLYVTMDKATSSTLWEKTILDYELEGLHFFATPVFMNYLKDNFGLNSALPRYMLFNSKGDLLDGNLPKPSTESKIKERISKIIKTNP